MRFTLVAALTAMLALPLAARADEPSAAMRVSDLAAEVLSQKPGTCEDKQHACEACKEGHCEACKEGHCEACESHGCDDCADAHDDR